MPTKFDTKTGEFIDIKDAKQKNIIELPDSTTILIKGDKGDKGDKGEDGKDGIDGKSIAGERGEKGEAGKDGIDGLPGKDGKDGIGIIGIAGKDGREVELGTSATHFQWRYVGEEWINLSPLPKNLTGISGGGRWRLKDLQDSLLAGSNITITQVDKKLVIASTGGGGSGHTIEDEGTPLTTRSKLNFVGAGVTVTDDSGDDATVVTILGGGSDVPLPGTVTYTGDQITEIALSGGNTYDITYNLDGTINTVDDGTYLRTFTYSTGKIASWTVT